MASQVITPMLKLFETVKVLHLEPTDICQASCPLCARETDREFDRELKHSLTVSALKKILPESIISQLDKMFMCGNYGDPAAGPTTLALYDYFRTINPNIVLGMNTNGGIRGTEWWTKLAERLHQPQDYVVFSIDGLEDTNHIYRRNVNWSRVMSNAVAFIKAGGSAHWDMLVYKHNQHQVEQCEQMARSMGFRWFRAKVSKRPLADTLQYPVNWVRPKPRSGPVECFAEKEQSIYIDAQGRISPCCWLGSRQSDFNFVNIATEKNSVCRATCSTDKSQTTFTAQWQRETQLC